MLVIDQREKDDDLIAAVIQRCEDFKEPYSFDTLTVGDFVFDAKIAIEHKSVKDFEQSLPTGHLDSQCADLKQFPVHALIISGRWKYKWNPKTHSTGRFTSRHKNGKIAAYVFGKEWNVPVVMVDTASEFADMLFMIKDQIDDLDTILVPEIITRHSRTANFGDDVLALYLSIKGIALKKAKALKELYPNPADFFAAYLQTGLPQVEKMTLNKTSREALDRICKTTWAVPIPKKPKK